MTYSCRARAGEIISRLFSKPRLLAAGAARQQFGSICRRGRVLVHGSLLVRWSVETGAGISMISDSRPSVASRSRLFFRQIPQNRLPSSSLAQQEEQKDGSSGSKTALGWCWAGMAAALVVIRLIYSPFVGMLEGLWMKEIFS